MLSLLNSLNEKPNYKERVLASAFLDEMLKLVNFVEKYAEKKTGNKFFEIRLALLMRKEMRELNKKFLQKDKDTDVLSFCDGEYSKGFGDEKSCGRGGRGSLSLDVALCPEVIKENAKRDEMSAAFALSETVLHALLHSLGEHHEYSEKSLAATHAKQFKLLQEMQLNEEVIDAFWKTLWRKETRATGKA